MQRDTCPSHRVDQAVDRGLWNVFPLLFNGFEKLLDIGGNWDTLVHVNPEHPKRSMGDMSGEYAGHGRTGKCSASRNCLQILLKHEVMAADEWLDNGPQDLITVSLCIQIAIDKMQLCCVRSLCLPIL
jgi:hypothetical protein